MFIKGLGKTKSNLVKQVFIEKLLWTVWEPESYRALDLRSAPLKNSQSSHRNKICCNYSLFLFKYRLGSVFTKEEQQAEMKALNKMYYLLSHIWLFATPWNAVCQAPLSWDSPGKNTRVGCHFLFQGIFPTQRLNPDLLHWRQIL